VAVGGGWRSAGRWQLQSSSPESSSSLGIECLARWLTASLAFMWGSEEEEEARELAAVAPKNDAVERGFGDEGIVAGSVLAWA